MSWPDCLVLLLFLLLFLASLPWRSCQRRALQVVHLVCRLALPWAVLLCCFLHFCPAILPAFFVELGQGLCEQVREDAPLLSRLPHPGSYWLFVAGLLVLVGLTHLALLDRARHTSERSTAPKKKSSCCSNQKGPTSRRSGLLVKNFLHRE